MMDVFSVVCGLIFGYVLGYIVGEDDKRQKGEIWEYL